MKTYLSILTVFALSLALMAQSPPPTVAAPRNSEQLNELLGPIALYPDALVALILPAATKPNDVLIAAQYLRGNGDVAQIDNLPWDESVKNLAHYSQVILWMDENMKWTEAVGDAFTEQPADVMNAVQVLRAKARAAGNLADTPQQNVVVDDGSIVIEPAQPNVIYVPQYDPALVYLARPYWYDAPLISFGFGFGIGPWLRYDCDWHQHGIWIGDRRRDWDRSGRGRWDGRRGDGHPWRPDANRPSSQRWDSSRTQAGIPHPRLAPGTPGASRERSSGMDHSGNDNRWDRSRSTVNNDWHRPAASGSLRDPDVTAPRNHVWQADRPSVTGRRSEVPTVTPPPVAPRADTRPSFPSRSVDDSQRRALFESRQSSTRPMAPMGGGGVNGYPSRQRDFGGDVNRYSAPTPSAPSAYRAPQAPSPSFAPPSRSFSSPPSSAPAFGGSGRGQPGSSFDRHDHDGSDRNRR